MFRPPFLARVAAGAAVYAIEETRRLPTAAANFPITAISQLLQTTMHAQQFVTSLALKGDAVFDRLANRPVEQPEWATFDEDTEFEQTFRDIAEAARVSAFDRYSELEPETAPETTAAPEAETVAEPADETAPAKAAEPEPEPETALAATASSNGAVEVIEPEVAARYDYTNMTLAQLRARLRVFSVEDLTALLDYEQQTRDRAPFVTMLTNRIATVRAK
ncbi:lipid droplet-associated protein [Nocardia wallacei]|uniref:lipid droplet-associated protein n=1 Tax=Nocardia wallacei TaxID=480035 RepID=UPI002457B3B5|nr:lipid droplet-associated protein [Nocardia wallacei]